MKPIIGIIMRYETNQSNKHIGYLYSDIVKAVIKSGGIPIGIDNQNILSYLDICNGFILQGGDDIDKNNLKVITTLYERDIPLLGICLGMQEIGYVSDGTIYDIIGHKNNDMHEVIIEKDSLLYRILGCQKTLVNSRHKSAIMNSKLTVSAISSDNIVEAIEDKKKRFFIGLQWHPENMYDSDLNSRKIFDYFIKICNDTE